MICSRAEFLSEPFLRRQTFERFFRKFSRMLFRALRNRTQTLFRTLRRFFGHLTLYYLFYTFDGHCSGSLRMLLSWPKPHVFKIGHSERYDQEQIIKHWVLSMKLGLPDTCELQHSFRGWQKVVKSMLMRSASAGQVQISLIFYYGWLRGAAGHRVLRAAFPTDRTGPPKDYLWQRGPMVARL